MQLPDEARTQTFGLKKQKGTMNSNSILCVQELKNQSHLKEELVLKFIKPINGQRPNHDMKTDSQASKNLAV